MEAFGGADERQIGGWRPTVAATGGEGRPFCTDQNCFGADLHCLGLRETSVLGTGKLYPEANDGNDQRRKFSYTWANTR